MNINTCMENTYQEEILGCDMNFRILLAAFGLSMMNYHRSITVTYFSGYWNTIQITE